MRFSVASKRLREALGYVSNAVERQFTYPALACVLVECEADGRVGLRATNNDITLVTRFEAEGTSEPGVFLVSGRRFLDVVHAVATDGFVADAGQVTSQGPLTGSIRPLLQ